MASDFHFSPRPNRAAEIRWRHWSGETFSQAQREDKPVLLAISAVWCHWCHVMDETTYSQSAVIDYINDHFVAVRVDNDQRPDINARYNMGGWPTTVVLTPQGSILTGGTYLPPPQMLRLLSEIREFYTGNKEQIAQRVAQQHAGARAPADAREHALHASMISQTVEHIAHSYDEEFGGFGVEPKFPQTDALELLLLEYRSGEAQQYYEMTAKTMLGMSRGGMYDHVEGGFFRYSTTRDWSVPHFEKMAEDHAGLLRVLCGLWEVSRTAEFRSTLLSSVRYLMSTLYDKAGGLFGGSQDADEAYYALPLSERRSASAPYIDRTAHSNWNAALAAALLDAGAILEDDAVASAATRALDILHERMRDGDGLLFHYLPPGGEPQVRGLLTDQAAYFRALLDAHERTGESRFFERATALHAAMRPLAATAGGYYDRCGGDALGNLAFQDRPLRDNAIVADCLVRLADMTGEDRYRTEAHDVLNVYAATFAKAGSFASPFASALKRFLASPVIVNIVGAPGETQTFREAARHLPDPLAVIRTIDPAAEGELRARGFPAGRAAYLCRGTTCSPPVSDASGMRAAFDGVAG